MYHRPVEKTTFMSFHVSEGGALFAGVLPIPASTAIGASTWGERTPPMVLPLASLA